MEGNGIASASDFRDAMLQSFGDPQAVKLPKLGKKVMLRRPSEMWWLFNGRLPITMAAKMSSGPTDGRVRVEEIVESAEWIFHVLTNIMVKPRCVMLPRKEDEISPDMVDMDDATFMVRWASGEEVTETDSLSTFRRDGSADNAGAIGGEVGMQAK